MVIDHKSFHTNVDVSGGAGTDSLLLRPRKPYTRDGNMVTQPGCGFWRWLGDDFESVKLETNWS